MPRTRLVAVAALSVMLTLAPRAAPSTTGAQDALVILGTSGTQPFSVAYAQSAVRDAADFYRVSSFGKLNLSFVVTPWFHAFTSDPGCQLTSQGTLDQAMLPARLAAQRAGYAPADYSHLIYVVANSHCAFWGTTWGHEVALTRPPNLELLLHELGHSLGLGHAMISSCAWNCTVTSPGDPYSPMGTGEELLDFSVYEKVALGWLPQQSRVTKNGTYTIAVAGRAVSMLHAVVIDDTRGQWWIEYRTHPFRGLLVRYVDLYDALPPFAPSPILIENPTHHHRNWMARNETFRGREFTIRLVGATATQARIRVRFNGS